MNIEINAEKQKSIDTRKGRTITSKELLSSVKRNVEKKQALLERLRNV